MTETGGAMEIVLGWLNSPPFTTFSAPTSWAEVLAFAAGAACALVCDTDAFATAVWDLRYRGEISPPTVAAAGIGLPPRGVYLLTVSVGVPFVQDGIRDGENVRAGMTAWFRDRLTAADHWWVPLKASLEDRLALGVRVVDELLKTRARFTEPLAPPVPMSTAA